jgi:hypothetical protein
MRLLLSAILILTLTGCATHEDYTITTVTPSSIEATDDMISIQASIKRIVNEQGVKDAMLYWVINDAQKKGNMAVFDITITVNELRQRFIFGLTDHVVTMVKEIEPEAEVDCQHEGEQYEGRHEA